MPRPPYRIPAATAVVVALAAMFGTGLYAALAPAAATAGVWFPLSILLACLLALGVVASTAHLATARPAGPELVRGDLPPAALRLGAVARLVSRTAAAAAAAAVFGAYVLPSQPVPVAVIAVVVVAGITAAGVRVSRGASRGLVVGTLLVLALVVGVGLLTDAPDAAQPSSAMPSAASEAAGAAVAEADGTPEDPVVGTLQAAVEPGPLGVLTGAAFVFFVFTGLSRVAELGGSLRDPIRAIRRAPAVAVLVTTVLLVLLSAALLHGLGVERLAASSTPLASLMDTGGSPALGVLVRIAAAAATAAALLGALSRAASGASVLARAGELPAVLGRGGARGTPWVAGLAVGAVAVGTVAFGPVAAIAVSVGAALVHHALLHLAVLRQPGRPATVAFVAGAGGTGCLLLAAVLPTGPMLVAALALAGLWGLCTVLARSAAVEGPAEEDGPSDPAERAA